MKTAEEMRERVLALIQGWLTDSNAKNNEQCVMLLNALAGDIQVISVEPVSSKAAEAPGGQPCTCAEVGRIYPFNGKTFCSNCRRRVVTPNWEGVAKNIARLIWPDNSEAFPGMSSPEAVAANKAFNEQQWMRISSIVLTELEKLAAPAAPSERADLEHAVSCMNRSCRKCNEIQRRFGPAQEGEGFRASTPPPAATVSAEEFHKQWRPDGELTDYGTWAAACVFAEAYARYINGRS